MWKCTDVHRDHYFPFVLIIVHLIMLKIVCFSHPADLDLLCLLHKSVSFFSNSQVDLSNVPRGSSETVWAIDNDVYNKHVLIIFTSNSTECLVWPFVGIASKRHFQWIVTTKESVEGWESLKKTHIQQKRIFCTSANHRLSLSPHNRSHRNVSLLSFFFIHQLLGFPQWGSKWYDFMTLVCTYNLKALLFISYKFVKGFLAITFL